MSNEININGISSVICNAIAALWDTGRQTEARQKILIVQDTGPFSEIVKNHGAAIYTITSPEPYLAAQFPPCMIFVLPLTESAGIMKAALKNRKTFLQELEVENQKDVHDHVPVDPTGRPLIEVLSSADDEEEGDEGDESPAPTFTPTAGLPEELVGLDNLYKHQLEPK